MSDDPKPGEPQLTTAHTILHELVAFRVVMRGKLPVTRETSLCFTKLEEAEHWLAAAIRKEGGGTDHG